MPRKFRVEGKSIQQLMRLRPATISKMSEKELRAVVTRLSSAANKRIRRIEAKGISTPATRGAEKSGGKFSGKGKNINELRTEYKRVKSFLKDETSTVKGYTKFAKRFSRKIEQVQTRERKKPKYKQLKAPAPPEQTTAPEQMPETPAGETWEQEGSEEDAQYFFDKYDKMFRIVDRLKEKNPWIHESISSPIVAMVEEYVNSNPEIDIDDATTVLDKQVQEWYETQERRDQNIKWSGAF